VALSKDQLQAVPAGLRERAQWVLWRYTQVDGKPRKVPYTVSGGHASHADPKTWASFDAVVKAMPKYDGVGFVFTEGDPYVGIDLDHCYDSQGTLKAWAVDLVRMAQEHECYIERTPSGQGLHIIGVGKLPGHGRKVTQIGEDRQGAIEVYDQLRYFTVTGDQTDLGDADGDASNILQWVWRSYGLKDDAPTHVEPGVAVADSEADRVALSLLERASAEFRALWLDMYDVNRHGTDRSAVRFSFLCQLAMKLATTGAPQTVALLRAVALRAPFIKSEMSSARGQKWPRLADSECTRAWAWVTEHVQGLAQGSQSDAQGEPLLLTYAQLREASESLSWVVKRVLPAESVGVMFGGSGSFKSFLALDVAMRIAHGLQWINQRTIQGHVVYLAAEGGVGVYRRVTAWHMEHKLDPNAGKFHFIRRPLALLTEAKSVRAEIEHLGVRPVLVVIDTLSQTFTGVEDSSSDMAPYLRSLRSDLAQAFKSCVLVLHHVGHGASERPRGSSAIQANSDFLIGVFRDENAMTTTAQVIHQKDGEIIKPVMFSLQSVDLGKDADGDPITSLVPHHLCNADEVLAQDKRKREGNMGRLLAAIATGCPESEARDRFYASQGDKTQEAKQKAFRRTLDAAIGAGAVLCEGDWLSISPVQEAGH